jgi:hypothetical protein
MVFFALNLPGTLTFYSVFHDVPEIQQRRIFSAWA